MFLFPLILFVNFLLNDICDYSIIDPNKVKIQISKNNLKIQSDEIIEYTEIYNLLGNIVLKAHNDLNIDISNIPTGFFIIKLYTPNGEYIKKIQKN